MVIKAKMMVFVIYLCPIWVSLLIFLRLSTETIAMEIPLTSSRVKTPKCFGRNQAKTNVMTLAKMLYLKLLISCPKEFRAEEQVIAMHIGKTNQLPMARYFPAKLFAYTNSQAGVPRAINTGMEMKLQQIVNIIALFN